jgi:glycosyltransferase involved in cell wall biosynthesis
MAAAGTDDVILLNSDTILYDGWTRRLLEAAYEDVDIGTATPLSNNASCYSMFQNVTPRNHLNAMLAEAEVPSLPIPVGTGFCLYIKREVLDRVGMFDPVFGKGYGEETDLCLRATTSGYRHVLAAKVFVYHAGGASMVAANVVPKGETTIPAHEQIIEKRYPTFAPSVQEFIGSGIIDSTARELNKRYIVQATTYRPTIAIVVHDDPFAQVVGGTTFHVRDLIQELEHDFVFYVITPDASKVRVTGYADGITYYYVPSTLDFTHMLEELNPSLIHIHHLLYFPSSFVDALTEWQGQKIFTIHDFYGVCPQYNLINYRQAYCGVPEPEECDRCAKKLFGTGYSTPATQRRRFQRLVDSVSTVLAPSRSALAVYRKAITVPEEKVRIIPHPFTDPRRDSGLKHLYASMSEPTVSESGEVARHSLPAGALYRLKKAQLRVGFVGYNSPHKGTALLQGIIATCSTDPIIFVGLGDITLNTKGARSVVLTGLYQREEAVQLIKQYLIDVVVVTSIWPESFSYVVSEAWKAGVPVVVGPLGAPAERVGETGAGTVVPDYRVQSFAAVLRRLLVDQDQLNQLKLAAAAVSQRKDYHEYRDLYFKHVPSVTDATRSFSSSVELVRNDMVDITQIPALVWLVGIRKRIFPVGSVREQLYFWMHNRISHVYAGGIRR